MILIPAARLPIADVVRAVLLVSRWTGNIEKIAGNLCHRFAINESRENLIKKEFAAALSLLIDFVPRRPTHPILAPTPLREAVGSDVHQNYTRKSTLKSQSIMHRWFIRCTEPSLPGALGCRKVATTGVTTGRKVQKLYAPAHEIISFGSKTQTRGYGPFAPSNVHSIF